MTDQNIPTTNIGSANPPPSQPVDTSGTPVTGDVQITNQFSAEPAKTEEEPPKDLFESGLKYEPPGTPTSTDSIPTPDPNTLEQEFSAPEPVSPPAQSPGFGMDSVNTSTDSRISEPSLPSDKPKRRSVLGLLIGAVVILVVLGGGGYAYFAFFAQKTITINLNVEQAKVLIDNQDHSSQVRNQTLSASLSGDVHSFEVSKDEYFTYTKSIDVSKLTGNKLEINLRSYPEVEAFMEFASSDLVVDDETGKLFYLSNGGKNLYVATLGSDGKVGDFEYPTKGIDLSGLRKSVLAPDFSTAIFEFDANKTKDKKFSVGGSKGTKTFLYSLTDSSVSLIKAGITEAAYSPDSKNLYYNDGDNLVMTSIEDLSVTEIILNTKKAGVIKPKIRVSSTADLLALVPQSNKFAENKLYLFDLSTSELTEVGETDNVIDAKFSPESTKLLYSTYDDTSATKHKLSVLGIKAQTVTVLEVVTSVALTAWLDEQTLAYASPGADSSNYTISNVDTENSKVTAYAYKSDSLNQVTEIAYSASKQAIYLVNSGLAYLFKPDDGAY